MADLSANYWGNSLPPQAVPEPTASPQDTNPQPASKLSADYWGGSQGPSAPTPAPTTPSVAPTTSPQAASKLSADYWGGSSAVPTTAPNPQVKPDNTYTMDTARQDPQLQGVLKSYYGAKGEDTTDPNTLFDKMMSDQRAQHQNSAYAVQAITEANNFKNTGNQEQINNIKAIRDAYDKLPDFWQKGGAGISGGFHDIVDNITDPVNIISVITLGMFGPEGLAAKAGLQAGIDFGIGAGFDVAQQKIDITTGAQKAMNEGEVLKAGIINATLPLVIGGTIKSISLAKDLTGEIFSKRSANLADMPEDATKFNSLFKTGEEASSYIKGITITHKEEAFTPIKIMTRDTLTPIADDAGKTMYFTSPLDAAQWYRANLEGAATQDLLPHELESQLQKYTDPNNQHFIMGERFNSVSDAKKFVKANGDQFGSTNFKDFYMSSNGVAGVNNGLADSFGLYMQRHIDMFYRMRQIVDETGKFLKTKLEDPTTSEEAATAYRAAITGPTPVQVAENNLNSHAVAEHMLGNMKVTDNGNVYRGSRVYYADDPNSPGSKYYAVDTGKKSLLSILADANDALKAKGVNEPMMGQEIFKYIFAKRVLSREFDAENPINTGVVLNQAQDFVKYIENDPFKADVYKTATEGIQDFNRDLLQFAVDHDYMSAESMKNLLDKNEFYMPIRRLDNFQEGYFGRNTGTAADTTKKTISDIDKPRGQTFLDPLQSYVEETYALIRNSMDNVARNKFYDMLNTAGPKWMSRFVEKTTGAGPLDVSVRAVRDALADAGIHIDVDEANKDMLSVWAKDNILKNNPDMDITFKGGKMQVYRIKDMMLKDAWGATPSNITKMVDMLSNTGVAKFMRETNGVYSVLLTHDPSVNLLSFLPSDAVGGWLFQPNIGKKWSSIVTNLPFINAARGMAANMESKEYREFMLNGGGLSGLRSNVTAEKRLVHMIREQGFTPEEVIGTGINADTALLTKFYHTILDHSGLDALARRTESAVRFNTYINNVTDGMSHGEAANAGAKSTIDFRLRGSSYESAQFQRAFFPPFTRAMFNALYQTGQRMFTEGSDSAVRWAKVLMTVPPTIALEHYLRGNETYQNVPEPTKDLYWFVPIPGQDGLLKIRKPHELAIPANIARHWLNEVAKSEEGRPIALMMGRYLVNQIAMNARSESVVGGLVGFAPQPLQGPLEVMLNKNPMGGDLNQKLQDGQLAAHSGSVGTTLHWASGDPEFQSYLQDFNQNWQTEFTPKDIETLILGTFGAVASYGYMASDAAFKDAQGIYQFKASSLPIVSRIYQPNRPVRNSGLDEKLYQYNTYVHSVMGDMRVQMTKANVPLIQQDAELMKDPQYQAYMRADGLLKQAEQIDSKFKQTVVKTYNDSKNDPKIEDRVDALFKDRNSIVRKLVVEIQKQLRTKSPILGEKEIQDWMDADTTVH